MKRMILITLTLLFITACVPRTSIGQPSTNSVEDFLSGGKNIEIFIDGHKTVSNLVASYMFAKTRQGGWVGSWEHINVITNYDEECLKVNYLEFTILPTIDIYPHGGITNFKRLTDGCSFTLNLNYMLSTFSSSNPNRIHVVIKQKDNNVDNTQTVILGNGLYYSKLDKKWKTETWKSIDGPYLKLPYLRIKENNIK